MELSVIDFLHSQIFFVAMTHLIRYPLLFLAMLPVLLNSAQSQTCVNILRKNESRFYSHVLNNVIYKIIYERYKCSEVEESDFKYLLPEKDHSYIIEFQCSELVFPDSNYVLYEYYFHRSLTPSKPDSLGYVIERSNLGIHFNEPISRGLILYDTVKNLYSLISGYAFLDPIYNYYFRNGFDSESLTAYCKVRYFNYQPTVEKVSVKNRFIDFYSEEMKRHYRVNLSKNRLGPELIEL